MKKGERSLVISTVLLCLLMLPFSAFSEYQKSSTELYLDELQAQGLQRVIVTFKEEIDLSLIEKYNGNVIRSLEIITGVVCEIPVENIELLKQEDKVKNVAIDGLIEAQPAYKEPDPEYLDRFLRCKKDYFRTIEKECRFAKQAAKIEFERILESLQDGYGYDAAYEEALAEYNEKLALADNAYITAVGEWREKVSEMVILSYGGPVELLWNHLEAGMNAKAAYDNYNLDGRGVKIAIIDTGIDYLLADLINNYLGGWDFVNGDNTPLPPNVDEWHGTAVASCVVCEGVSVQIGIAYKAGFYALRVLQGESATGFVSNVISAIQWAMDPDGNPTTDDKADIINMSFGSYSTNPDKAELESACNAAYAEGIIIVAGSGNSGYTYSAWPASFDNVISVGAYGENQTIWDDQYGASNGGVDIVAPGARVPIMNPGGSLWWGWGTSAAAPHAAGLIALQLQYARRDTRDIDGKYPFDVNNGCLWETMKHAALQLTGETYNSVYQGKGKIWAAKTNVADPDPGSIGLMSSSIWPFDDFIFTYSNYVYLTAEGYPAYFIGTNMYQNITLTNITNALGNTAEGIENLNVTTTQAYYQHDGEVNMPGSPIEVFPTTTLNAGAQAIFSDTYYIPYSTIPGLDRTQLDINFNFVGNSRLLTISLPYASIWCPPPEINDGFPK